MKSRKTFVQGEPLPITNNDVLLSKQAELSSGVLLEWIADTQNKTDEYLGMITLVANDKRILVADNLPEDTCQNLFNSLCDAYSASGYSPVITYCSFD